MNAYSQSVKPIGIVMEIDVVGLNGVSTITEDMGRGYATIEQFVEGMTRNFTNVGWRIFVGGEQIMFGDGNYDPIIHPEYTTTRRYYKNLSYSER